jgi:hypothetical protein
MHYGWYLFGFIVAPRLTFMIFLSYHCPTLPVWFMITGWILVILSGIGGTKWTVK